MHFHVMTLFPEMIEAGIHTSITGRAIDSAVIGLTTWQIRDYTTNRQGMVDDYTYGGGAGMLMQAQPVYDCYRAVCDAIAKEKNGGDDTCPGRRPRTIFMSPQGRRFDQEVAKELAKEEDLILLCGHYEGIDERVLEEIVTDEISAGDFILTGGELPAMMLIDCVARLIPGVLHNDTSADIESFEGDLLEYPQYSRPEVWNGKRVPEILLSGDHKKVEEWRHARSVERTRDKRPDMYERYECALIEKQLATKKGYRLWWGYGI